MALKPSASSTRPLLELFHPTRRRPTCAKLNQFSQTKSPFCSRNVSTVAPQHSEMEVDNSARPRWSYTPPAMAAPVRSRLPRREQPWKVNDDPAKLDSVYVRFLGPGGDEMLTDETKWLAVTHKSFDHGRRGFNDRLSYIGRLTITKCLGSSESNWLRSIAGRRIVELQMTLALLSSSAKDVFKVGEDPHGRDPFQHPAIEGIEVLNGGARAHLLHHKRIAETCQQYGLQHVIRWNPKRVSSRVAPLLQTSGLIFSSPITLTHLGMKWSLRKRSMLLSELLL